MDNGMDVERLGDFSPFNALKSTNLEDLLAHIEMGEVAPGQALFAQGDTAQRAYYVLSGSVSLENDAQSLGKIKGGTPEASNALAPTLPRQVSAIAVDNVRFFSIDSEYLDVTLTLDQTGVYEVGELNSELGGAEADWMTALLRARIFELIPPQNIQAVFSKLQRIDFKAGHVVIKQGTDADYFYIVRSGTCMVSRETPADKPNIDLCEMRVGATFGEEALISEEPRNATVTMVTDGILMRLGRDDFQALLNEPLVMSLSATDADEAVRQGGQWLDVRVPSEYAANSKKGATNLPLYMLRHQLNSLDPATPYVIYCDTGRRSSAAAFILNQRGFETAVLEGGLNHAAA